LFQAEDVSDSRFYLFATLHSGAVRFEVVARLNTGERGAVSGREFFAAMMDHFAPQVRVIQADWNRASGLTTNIDQFNRATAAGLDPERAAALTWTGLRASEYGYDVVSITATDPATPSVSYDTVRVEFCR
jgi:hypothetical protein